MVPLGNDEKTPCCAGRAVPTTPGKSTKEWLVSTGFKVSQPSRALLQSRGTTVLNELAVGEEMGERVGEKRAGK